MKHTFYVSIDDGDCEYSYPIELDDSLSIRDVYKKLCEAYGAEPDEGTYLARPFRTRHADTTVDNL